MGLWKSIKKNPIFQAVKKVASLEEVIEEEVSDAVTIGMETALQNLQELRGRKVKLSVVVTVDEILGVE